MTAVWKRRPNDVEVGVRIEMSLIGCGNGGGWGLILPRTKSASVRAGTFSAKISQKKNWPAEPNRAFATK
jgi:hypothetical protein